MKSERTKWYILTFVSLIWGSSYILMKWSLKGLTPVQVGALRMFLAAVFLIVPGFKLLKEIKLHQWKYVLYNALLGTFFPVFLFTFSISHIDSSIVAVLNSTTPLFTLITGILFFRSHIRKKQMAGVLIGFGGTVFLIVQSAGLHPGQNYIFALPVLFASIGYALNVNILKKYLNDVNPMAIATGNFLIVFLPALFILYQSGFFHLEFSQTPVYKGIFYTAILALFGTALAKVLFNKLIQISSPVFSSAVTYTIPLVSVLWGLADGEKLYIIQILAAGTILLGIVLTGKDSS